MKHCNVAFFVPHMGCPHRCSFCNQFEISGQLRAPSPEDAAETARAALQSLGSRAAEAEFAFFGGSFTAIPRENMTALLAAVTPFVGHGGFRGIRISTRPDAINQEILDILKRYGVTSIELGAQSMDDRVLKANGRGHTAADVNDASALIRASGFTLGLQMMTGLYLDTDDGAVLTAQALCALSPATVRVYPTLVLKGTRLARLYEAGLYRPQTLEEAVSLGARLLSLFFQNGVRVIRLGLHETRELEQSYIAGPLHPALRELCENRIYYEKARSLLSTLPRGGNRTLKTDVSAVSKLAGQHRCNLLALEREFGGTVKVMGRPMKPYEISLVTEEETCC